LYPAAGVAISALTAAQGAGIQKIGEAIEGKKHEKNAMDVYLEQFKDAEKHPWVGPLKIYLGSLITALAQERVKRYMNIVLDEVTSKKTKKEKKRLDDEIKYAMEDEAEQVAGSFYSNVGHSAYDTVQSSFGHHRGGMTKTQVFEQWVDKELNNWVPRAKPLVDKITHQKPKKQ
jgi:uncharacterized protein YdaU (DUF1376 family)